MLPNAGRDHIFVMWINLRNLYEICDLRHFAILLILLIYGSLVYRSTYHIRERIRINAKSELLPGHYYCTKDVSEIFGVNESTIKHWTDSGKLKR